MDRRTRRKLMDRLLADARLIAAQFALEYRVIEPERANVKSRYGICYDDGTIRIRLMHAVSGKPLKYSSLVSTLCHELAHIRHFDHGPKFRAFNQEVLAWARRQGIYRPGNPPPTAAAAQPESRDAQLDLRDAIRSGRLPTLRESLRGVLPPLNEAPASGCAAPGPQTSSSTTRSPSQLELFESSRGACTDVSEMRDPVIAGPAITGKGDSRGLPI